MSKPTPRAPHTRRRLKAPRHRPLPVERGPAGIAAAATPEAPAFIEPAERQGMIAEAECPRADARGFDPGHTVDDRLAQNDVEHPPPSPAAPRFAGG